MALKIRLARKGSKKRPYYHIVIADARAPRDGRFIEKVGTYNPLLPKDNENRFTLVQERIAHWIERGAKPTDRILRFLDAAGMLRRPVRHNPKKGTPGEKARERSEKRLAQVSGDEAEADAAGSESS